MKYLDPTAKYKGLSSRQKMFMTWIAQSTFVRDRKKIFVNDKGFLVEIWGDDAEEIIRSVAVLYVLGMALTKIARYSGCTTPTIQRLMAAFSIHWKIGERTSRQYVATKKRYEHLFPIR